MAGGRGGGLPGPKTTGQHSTIRYSTMKYKIIQGHATDRVFKAYFAYRYSTVYGSSTVN